MENISHQSAASSNDASEAFEKLREEVSLLTAALSGMTAAKEKIPDYTPTLRGLAHQLDVIDKRLTQIAAHPAMKLTPAIIATEIANGAITVRAEDRAAIGAAREALAHSLGHAQTLLKIRRSTTEQEWWVCWAATGGMLFGALFALVGVASWG